MANWNLTSEETVTAPKHVTVQAERTNSHGRTRTITHTTKQLAGGTVEETYLHWRCMNCRAMACTIAPTRMTGKCGKCGT